MDLLLILGAGVVLALLISATLRTPTPQVIYVPIETQRGDGLGCLLLIIMLLLGILVLLAAGPR